MPVAQPRCIRNTGHGQYRQYGTRHGVRSEELVDQCRLVADIQTQGNADHGVSRGRDQHPESRELNESQWKPEQCPVRPYPKRRPGESHAVRAEVSLLGTSAAKGPQSRADATQSCEARMSRAGSEHMKLMHQHK